MGDELLHRRIEDLERQLSEAEQAVRAITSGEIDAVLDASTSTPLLLQAAQEELRVNERLFRAVFDGAMDAMLIADDEGRYVDANPAACLLFGLPRDRLIGRCVTEFGEAKAATVLTWNAFLGQRQMSGIFRLVRPDGGVREAEFHAIAGILPQRNLSVLRDVTEKQRSEARFRAMIEKSQDGIGLVDAQGQLTYASPAMAQIFDREVAELLAVPGSRFVHEDDRERVRATRAGLLASPAEPASLEFRVRHQDGSIHWVEATARNFLLDPAIGAIVANYRDITEHVASQAAVHRLASIVSSSEDAIISRGVDGIIRTWNRGAERLTLYSAAEAIGQPIAMLYPPEQAAALDARRRGFDAGTMPAQFEMVMVRKDGSRVEVAKTSSALRDEQGVGVGASIIVRDMTERRLADAALRRSEEQLRQAQKMEAIGSLAGGVAHDFNNLLSVILSYSTMILDDLRPNDPLRTDLDEIHNAAMRATALTRQLLAFSRQQVLQPVVLDLNQVVAGIERMLQRLLREDIRLTLLGEPNLGKILADPGQIEQVIMNLVVNARDAMPAGGNLTLETSTVTIDESYAVNHTGVKPGPYVLLAVTDTGTGMDAATMARIFDPFFTTKDKSKGTGLGLSTVYGIIQQSGGHIWVYSEPGLGSTFKVYLPRTDRVEEARPAAPETPLILDGHETILLVEDEEQVRVIMRTILRKRGYNVVEAQNGGEAFLLCEQFTGRIDMLLTDVVMPRMSGPQVAERLLQLRPEMKVLFVSGYADDTVVHHGILDAGIDFLQKPIMPMALLRKVRQVLDSPPRQRSAVR